MGPPRPHARAIPTLTSGHTPAGARYSERLLEVDATSALDLTKKVRERLTLFSMFHCIQESRSGTWRAQEADGPCTFEKLIRVHLIKLERIAGL